MSIRPYFHLTAQGGACLRPSHKGIISGCAPHREVGSASTWSLERLDALAAEAAALFEQRSRLGMPPRQMRGRAVDLQPKPSRKESLSSIVTGAQPISSRSAESSNGTGEVRVEAAAHEESRRSQVGKRIGKALRIGNASSSSNSTIVHAGPTQHGHSERRKSPTSSRKEPALMPKPAKQSAPALGSTSGQAASRDRQPTSKTRVEQSPDGHHSPLHRETRESVESPSSARGADPSCALAEAAVCRFPTHALSAINDVLFGRHGYRRMAKHGDPRQAYRLRQCLIALLGCVASRLLRPILGHNLTSPVCLDIAWQCCGEFSN